MSYQMRSWQHTCVQLNHEDLVAGSTVQQHTASVLRRHVWEACAAAYQNTSSSMSVCILCVLFKNICFSMSFYILLYVAQRDHSLQ